MRILKKTEIKKIQMKKQILTNQNKMEKKKRMKIKHEKLKLKTKNKKLEWVL